MDRVAVFVDAGYLFAGGSILLTGEKPPLPRRELDLNQEVVVGVLTEFATRLTGLPLLRIYWYDGASSGPTQQHRALASSPTIKLRLGIVSPLGKQKGVDSLIVADLINLPRNHAMADAVLLGGDEDLRVGVQQAQEFGVRVHLLGFKPLADDKNQSLYLVEEVDTLHEWEKSDVEKFLSVHFDIPQAEDLPEGSGPLHVVAEAVATQLSSNELHAVTTSSEYWRSREIDASLLFWGSRILGKPRLCNNERSQIRSAFMTACRRLATLPPLSSQPETRPARRSVLEILSRPSGRSFDEFGDDAKLAAENAASANDAYDAAIRAFKDKYEEPTPEEDPEDSYADEALEAGREAYDAYITKHGNEEPHKP